jgi:hypothetical protein
VKGSIEANNDGEAVGENGLGDNKVWPFLCCFSIAADSGDINALDPDDDDEVALADDVNDDDDDDDDDDDEPMVQVPRTIT